MASESDSAPRLQVLVSLDGIELGAVAASVLFERIYLVFWAAHLYLFYIDLNHTLDLLAIRQTTHYALAISVITREISSLSVPSTRETRS